MTYTELLRSKVQNDAIHHLEVVVVDRNLSAVVAAEIEPLDDVLSFLKVVQAEYAFLGVVTDMSAVAQVQRTILVFLDKHSTERPCLVKIDDEVARAVAELGNGKHFAIARNDRLQASMEYWRLCRKHIGKELLFTPAAGALVQDTQGRVLLQRRTDDGTWGILGGGVEIGETPEIAAIREVHEESGFVVEIDRLLSVATGDDCFVKYPNGDHLKFWGFLFLARLVGGSANLDPRETSELRWFTIHEIEELPSLNTYAKNNFMNLQNREPRVLGFRQGNTND